MAKVHDRGGWPIERPIDQVEHPITDWEQEFDALVGLLVLRRVMTGDQLRRVLEAIPLKHYETMTYYERWVHAVEEFMNENGTVTAAEMELKMAELKAYQAGN